MLERKYYHSIDIMKYICAIMVLSIHMAPLEQISPLLNDLWGSVICRVAVPFFFMASSFFFFKKEGSRKKNFTMYAKRILILYAIYTVIYLVILIIKNQLKSPIRTVQEILFSGVCIHLWYFVAIVVGIGMVILLEKLINEKVTAIISLVLYVIGTLGSTYYSLLFEDNLAGVIISEYMDIFLSVRNGIFFGMIFVVLGKVVIKREQKIINRSFLFWIVLFGITMCFMCVEGIAINKLTAKIYGRDMFLFLPICAYVLFGLILKVNQYIKNMSRTICGYFRNVSTLFYAMHYVFIFFIPMENVLAKFLLIIVMNTLISMFIVWSSRKIKVLNYLY